MAQPSVPYLLATLHASPCSGSARFGSARFGRSLSDFEQSLYEAEAVNRLREALDLFGEISRQVGRQWHVGGAQPMAGAAADAWRSSVYDGAGHSSSSTLAKSARAWQRAL